MTTLDQPTREFAPDKKPLIRGSPHTPWHPSGGDRVVDPAKMVKPYVAQPGT